MLAQERPKNNKPKAPINSVLITGLANTHTMSACIEALKYYAGLNDAEASQGLSSLPFIAYTSSSRDVALSVSNDLIKFGFNCTVTSA